MHVEEFKNIVWDITRKISENSNKVFIAIAEQYGVTMLQARILMELYKHGPHTMGSLAENVNIAGTNISAMCKKLERMGYIERVRDQEDERVVKVKLTENGHNTALKIDKAIYERISQLIADESRETLEEIVLGMKKLNGLLSKI